MATTRDNANTPAAKPADTAPAATGQGRVLPAGGPVDVPRTPAQENIKDDVAGHQSRPASNPNEDTSWADTALPAPNKKNARSNPY